MSKSTITKDVLQMMGRAGRPQFDDFGVAMVYVHDVKKEYYKKFLYEPFPVESRWDLLQQCDHTVDYYCSNFVV